MPVVGGSRAGTGRAEAIDHSHERWLETLRALDVSREDRLGHTRTDPLLLELITAEVDPARRPSGDRIFELFVRLPVALSGDAEADPVIDVC